MGSPNNIFKVIATLTLWVGIVFSFIVITRGRTIIGLENMRVFIISQTVLFLLGIITTMFMWGRRIIEPPEVKSDTESEM
jgi:hypothetical protein